MKLLSGKTAPWWPNVKRAVSRRRSDFCCGQKSYLFLGMDVPSCYKKRYFLAVGMDSNAVMSLFPATYPFEKKESPALGSERQRGKWVLCLLLPCRPEPPCEFPIAGTMGLWKAGRAANAGMK